MEIKYVELLHKAGKEILDIDNGIYKYNDVEIEIKSDGAIFVKAEKSEIYSINVHIENTYFEKAYILGDTWERAYGDLDWELMSEKAMPWYFIAIENEKIYGFGVKTQPNAMCSWKCNPKEIILNVDIRNGTNPICLNGRTIKACEVIIFESEKDVYSASEDFCGIMCDAPRIKDTVIYGGNDWYCNYGDNSYDKIIKHAKRIAECSPQGEIRPYMVVDAGWGICHHLNGNYDDYFDGGPWEWGNSKFGDMKKLAEEITAMGVVPGIWIRPLYTVENFPKECIFKREGIKYTLDPSSQITLKQVKSDIETIKSWGYKLIKHDFSTYDIFGQWGFEMQDDVFRSEVSFSDKTKTTAEIIKNFYTVIREAAGDDVLVLGCNTLSHLSAGIFDIQRTGDDTSGREWERTRKMGINTLAFRMCQHNKFYIVDADCVGITNCIEWKKNRQ